MEHTIAGREKRPFSLHELLYYHGAMGIHIMVVALIVDLVGDDPAIAKTYCYLMKLPMLEKKRR